MATPSLDFWFAIGSTYTYLTVTRIDALAHAEGVAVRWRPFNIRTITREQNNSPFAGKPIKAAYMWKDISRRALKYGFSAKVPAPYPIAGFEIANLVAVVGMDEGWGPTYVRETYRRWMVEGNEAGSEPNLSESIRAAGQDPARVLTTARADSVANAFAEATDEVRRLGIFGAPSFVAKGEVFWGDDRLEDAVQWLKTGST